MVFLTEIISHGGIHQGRQNTNQGRLTTQLGTVSTTASISGGYNASCTSCAIAAASSGVFYSDRTGGADDADDTDDHVGPSSFSPADVMCDAELSREDV